MSTNDDNRNTPDQAPAEHVEPVGSTQQDVLDYLRNRPSGITFVHGKAGCGKTYLIRQIEKSVAGCQVLVPTNLAATLYKKARTIHSYFWSSFDQLEEGFQNPDALTEAKVAQTAVQLSGVSMLVIDEISMVRADTFEMMDRICRLGLKSDRPFGGLPIVAVGDLFQLPPVVNDTAVEQYLRQEYGGIYFFNSHTIQDNLNDVRLFELTKSYRQLNDPTFVSFLDAFREPLSPERKIELLDGLNARVSTELPDDAIYIASSNEEVKNVNTRKIEELPGEAFRIEARYKIRLRNGKGYAELGHSELPGDSDIEPVVLPSQYDGILTVKKGARVMLTKSSRRYGYNNGETGKVIHFNGEYFTIRLDSGEMIECPNPRDFYKNSQLNEDRFEMRYDTRKHRLTRGELIQRTTQYPVKPAYAFTIHKSQGQTYDKVISDLESHIFAPGQLYVALSRAKSMQGLFLTKEIAYSDIISDNSIFLFLNKLRLANGAPRPGSRGSRQPDAHAAGRQPCLSNPRCDDFITFARLNEENRSTRDFLCHTLAGYRDVFAAGDFTLAHAELRKVVDLINATYITDRYEPLLARMAAMRDDEADCRFTLNAIFEIYTDVIHAPRQKLTTDNKFLTN